MKKDGSKSLCGDHAAASELFHVPVAFGVRRIRDEFNFAKLAVIQNAVALHDGFTRPVGQGHEISLRPAGRRPKLLAHFQPKTRRARRSI